MTTPRFVLALLFAAVVLQSVSYYPQLPSTVASSFGGGGRPSGWSSKEVFFGIYLGIVALLVFAFLGLPFFWRRFTATSLNLPNKKYWLAPERRAETFSLLESQVLWFGNATLALLLCVIQLAIQANLPGGRFSEPAMWLLMGTYLAWMVVWLIRFYRRFAKPPASSSSATSGGVVQ